MKKTFIIAAVALTAFAGAASAGSVDQILNYAPNADLSALTKGEIVHILSEISGNQSEAETTASVRSLVNAFQ